jgi:hypothetical protein
MATHMSRTLITLTTAEMRWLKKASKQRRMSMASLVREALVEYRAQSEMPGTATPLEKTAGIWKGRAIDGLDYVEKLRDEWDR